MLSDQTKQLRRIKNGTFKVKGKHIIYLERVKIEVLFKEYLKHTEISYRLERNRRTIERELLKDMVRLEGSYKTRLDYSADLGQKVHDERATNKGQTLKIGWEIFKKIR